MWKRTTLTALILTSLTANGSHSVAEAGEAGTKKLLTTIDCTKEYGPDAYFGFGDVRVTQSAAGTYREAGLNPESRFGYRFAIEQVGRPHLAVIRYPDDKNRCMAIMDGSSYDLSVGVCTGASRPGGNVYSFAQPITGRMLELRQVFWPRWRDCSIVFGNVLKDEPAAAASVVIYELDNLPALAVPGDLQDGSRRTLGIQYEDPCGAAAELGATDRREWIERLITYARYSGQNTLAYPIVWYHGPLYPSQREPVNYIGMTSSKVDRQLISHWTTQPEDWLAELLERFGQEQMQFRAVLPVLRLGSLMEKMNVDLESIKAGQDTINNMTFKDQVQMGTYDWTVKYNLRNFQTILDAGGNQFSGSTAWVYGEKSGRPDGFRGAIFNPLHPTVQEALLGLVQEVVDRYGRYPAFQGIDLWFDPTTIFWFGSLNSGYDDYTVTLFEKETGIVVPVDAKAPDRFSKRYAFLTGEVKPKWVAWRCEKIADLFRRIRDVVVKSRPDLQVMLVNVLKGNETAQREGGLDIHLLAGEPGIEISGIWNFNGWVERWGKHRWLPCDPKLRELATIMGQPPEGVMRESLEYPPDGFWWDQQWRITPTYPNGVHFLQPYAEALATYDTLSLRRGGLTLDTGHAEMIRPFALAYRALPAKRFETLGDSTDPVAVRTLVDEGKRYLYLVNQQGKPVSVEVQLDKTTGTATDLATNQKVEAPQRWTVRLGPYQLRSFGLGPQVAITGRTITREDPRATQPKLSTLVTAANPTITASQENSGPGTDWDADNVFENKLDQDTTPANGVPDHLDYARGTAGYAPVNLRSTYDKNQEYSSTKTAASDAFIEFDFGKPVRLDGWSFWDRTIGVDSSHRVSLTFSTDAKFDANDTVIQFNTTVWDGQSVQHFFSFPTQTVRYVRYDVTAGPVYDGAGEIRFYQAVAETKER